LIILRYKAVMAAAPDSVEMTMTVEYAGLPPDKFHEKEEVSVATQEADEMYPAADLLQHLLGELVRRGQQLWPPRRQLKHEGTSVEMVPEQP
jgi:hypothetical protein